MLVLSAVCCLLFTQLLLSAKQQLETVVHQKLEEAVAAREHAAVLRFVLLHQPLAVPDQGISRCAGSTWTVPCKMACTCDVSARMQLAAQAIGRPA